MIHILQTAALRHKGPLKNFPRAPPFERLSLQRKQCYREVFRTTTATTIGRTPSGGLLAVALTN